MEFNIDGPVTGSEMLKIFEQIPHGALDNQVLKEMSDLGGKGCSGKQVRLASLG